MKTYKGETDFGFNCRFEANENFSFVSVYWKCHAMCWHHSTEAEWYYQSIFKVLNIPK